MLYETTAQPTSAEQENTILGAGFCLGTGWCCGQDTEERQRVQVLFSALLLIPWVAGARISLPFCLLSPIDMTRALRMG